MSSAPIHHVLGAAVTIVLGSLGLVRPSAAAHFTSLEPRGPRGLAEIRATYGGFFLALGLYSVVHPNPASFEMLGWAWCSAAAARCLSVVLDRPRGPMNLGAVVFEGLVGALLVY